MIKFNRSLFYITSLFIFLVLVVLISGVVGTARISPINVIRISIDKLPLIDIEKTWDESEELALLNWRLPRIMIGVVVGCGLAIVGSVFQALLRNPLADPYILGVSSGGSLGAVIAIIVGVDEVRGISVLPVFAFLGSLLTISFVYSIARVDGRIPVHTLLLAGVIVNAFFSAIIMFLVSMVRENETHKFLIWSMGNLSPMETGVIALAMTLILLGSIGLYYNARAFNLLSLGEESAAQLGTEVEQVKKVSFLLASLVTGASVSICGVIGFVGLIVPHIVRMVIGADHRILMPASALAGASFLVLADTIARTIVSPAELPVGVITALAGGPFFIYLLRSRSPRWGG